MSDILVIFCGSVMRSCGSVVVSAVWFLSVYDRCVQCTRVRYCSAACCKESWERYHRIECRFMDLLHSVWHFYLCVTVLYMFDLAKRVIIDRLSAIIVSL